MKNSPANITLLSFINMRRAFKTHRWNFVMMPDVEAV